MSHFNSRDYSGVSDLERLIAFASQAARARLPRSTYMKGGDPVWALYASRFPPSEDIRIWSEGSEVLAYAIFERPLLFYYDVHVDEGSLLSDEILVWAETRRRTLGELSLESLPKAYQALGTDTISTTALGLYKSCGFVAVDRASYYVKHMR